jgi:hypothetical protein
MCVWVYVCIIAAAATGFLTRRACLPGPRCAACSGSWSRCEQTKAFTHVPNFLNSNICPDTPRTAEDAEYDECVGRTGSAGDRGSLPAFGALGTCRGAARVGSDERDCVTCAVAVALTVCIFCHRNGAASAHGLAESVHCSTIVLCHNPIWSDA